MQNVSRKTSMQNERIYHELTRDALNSVSLHGDSRARARGSRLGEYVERGLMASECEALVDEMYARYKRCFCETVIKYGLKDVAEFAGSHMDMLEAAWEELCMKHDAGHLPYLNEMASRDSAMCVYRDFLDVLKEQLWDRVVRPALIAAALKSVDEVLARRGASS